ncbi:MAG: ATP-binding protein [Acidobacteriaceae bacterium]|nr:ATP-binding protein [Acidobacteriaceae bacterium]
MSVPCPPRSLTIIAKPASLGLITGFVRKGALAAGLSEERASELDLIIEELIINVCNYAYPEETPGDVTITYSVPARGELSVEVADQGIAFNPLEAPPPDLSLSLEARPMGGLGIHLVKTIATSLTYRYEQGWNRLSFVVAAGS